jgi:hypothetical protein
LFIGAPAAKLRYDRRMSLSGAPPTWTEARGFLRDKFALAKDSDDLVALAWRIPIDGQEFVQWIRVSPLNVEGESWLMILADICPQSALSAPTAFEYLNELSFGALLLWSSKYLFRHTVALEWFAIAGLEHLVRRVAYEAIRLRLAISQTDPLAKPAEGSAESEAGQVEGRAFGHYDE